MSLELEIVRRNALLSAWREVGGVPVEGGWEVGAEDYEGMLRWGVRCAVCGGIRWESLRSQEAEELERWSLEWSERTMITRLVDRGCPHLTPLLSPPPESVLALAALLVLEARL